MNVAQQIERFEGRRTQAYPDPLTKGEPWTIGVGHTGPDVQQWTEWTDAEVDAALADDLAKARSACETLPWFASLNEPRQAVLIGMAFQLGVAGMLAFTRTLAAIRDERFRDAAEHMRVSKWAQQTPRRVAVLAHQMATGEWQA